MQGTHRLLLSVAGLWLVGQKSIKFKGQCFVETAVSKVATEKQQPERYNQFRRQLERKVAIL